MGNVSAEVRARLIRQAVLEQLERYAAIVGDPGLTSVRITVNVAASGAPRSVVVEPQFRAESCRA